MNTHDKDLILATTVGSSVLYLILSFLLPHSALPTLAVVYIVANMVTKLRGFESWTSKWNWDQVTAKAASITKSTPTSSGGGDRKFNSLPQAKRVEIISSIKSLQLYAANNKKYNDKRRKLFKLMSWRQQNLCKNVGYLDKLHTVDQLINKNQGVLNKIVDLVITDYDINFSDFDLVRNFNDNSSYRVIESLSHINRDWKMDGDAEEFELAPILKYIYQSLEAVIPESQKLETCILLPGSGLGRIPHELAKSGYGHVHSIEFSGLMYLFNKFVYLNQDLPVNDLEIFPYIHTNSNFVTLNDQFRSTLIPQVEKPANLSIHLEDFTLFEIPEPEKYKNVVIVTAFFIDTAENLVDYLDTISDFTKPFKNGYWINIGPLKYGTAPQVELNGEELAQLRLNMGWVDLNSINTLEKPIDNQSGLYSYVTDKKSLWQGYYGLNGWCSKRKENCK